MSETLKREVEKYVDFRVAGQRVLMPYVLSKRRWRFWRTSGKGTPEQIRQELEEQAEKKGVVLANLPPQQIARFMRREGIGIDCSGFVFQVLKVWLRETRGLSLEDCLLRFPGLLGRLERKLFCYKRERRISAAVLTSDLNTVRVERVGDIQSGDLIRLTPRAWRGKHVALVVSVGAERIVYAHSSYETFLPGPHYGEIRVVDPEKDLGVQDWREVTKDGKNYGKVAYLKERGDSVRRLKCLA